MRVKGPLFYKLLIVVATVIWGISFVVMKDAVDVLQPAYLVGIRFLITGILLCIVFWKRVRAALTKDNLRAGLILGVLEFAGFWTQTIGLAYTTPGINAFLTGTYCVLVPFVWWVVARNRPTVFNLVAAVLCVAGIGLVSVQSGSTFTIGFGEAMTLVCSVIFALHIVYVNKLSQGRDVLALTIFQFFVGGVLGLAIGACFETLPPVSAVTFDLVWNMVYLIVFASCLALVFQNVAIAHVPPAPAAVLLSLESVFGVLFSVLLYGESLTLRLVTGFSLIFVAILVSEALPILWRGRRARAQATSSAGSEAKAEGKDPGEEEASAPSGGSQADALSEETAVQTTWEDETIAEDSLAPME